MGKRAASAAPAAATKVAKTQAELVLGKCEVVLAALRRSQTLPPAVCDMLREMLPFSLAICPEERHVFQQGVVGMVAAELAKVEESMVAAVGEAETRLSELGHERESKEAEVVELSAKLEERQAATHAKKHALAGDALTFRSAKESLAEAQGKLKASEEAITSARGKREEFEAALKEGLAPLKEGTLDPAAVPEAAAALVPRLQRFFKLEESLVWAVPTVLAKEPAARGPFDTLALSQLEEAAQKAAEAFTAEAEKAEAGRPDEETAVRSAQEALALAKDRQHASADAFTAQRREEEECEASLQAAKQALRGVAPERRKREKVLNQAQTALQELREGPLAAFRELHEKTAPATAAPEPEPEAADAPMAAEQAS